jgi:multidrug resistance efflux pump
MRIMTIKNALLVGAKVAATTALMAVVMLASFYPDL